ncbi:alkaline phosphatase family protein [Geomonas agri]|uniref:alkaline phosphatase family protein n=1 Tax=Geomonas agri TaxID=2873702 RepID=UPI001CD60B88|nr:alkaline phosphatase family protein [Geomonas agri]
MPSLTSLLKSFIRTTLLLAGSILLNGVLLGPAAAGQAQYVIGISVDGGGASYIQNLINQGLLPNFKRFQTQGAWTNNARNDYDITVTLPNHVSMVTGRGVYGVAGNGHMWTSNSDPSSDPVAATYSIQNNKGTYVYGVFDVVHDNGLRTALYVTKTKFSLFDHSYNNGNGAVDNIGSDNGLNKIDSYVYNSSSSAISTSLVNTMKATPFNYVLLHFTDGDTAGHTYGWGSTAYNNALIAVDSYLGHIFDLVTGTPALQGKTDIILTADHGGNGTNHADITDRLNYTIPFYVWGPDAQAGTDLYTLNQSTRADPGTTRPAYTISVQPIRNGELANLALNILELGIVPDSTINALQNLAITSPNATGECGSDNGRILTAEPVNLCNAGISSAVGGSGPWAWTCTDGGVGVSCSASILSLPVITTISPLPSGTVGVYYSRNLEATGGEIPYIWSLVSGSLPPGLSMQSGVISGTPTVGGTSGFTARVTDAAGSIAEKSLSLSVIATPLQITTGSSLPNATKKVAYSVQLIASGGTTPYVWSIASGKLPPGLSLNSTTGVINGKASKAGVSTFTIKVTDAQKNTVTRSFSLTVK